MILNITYLVSVWISIDYNYSYLLHIPCPELFIFCFKSLERVFGLQVRCRELDIFKLFEKLFGDFLDLFWIFWEIFLVFLGLFVKYFLVVSFREVILGGYFLENFFWRIFWGEDFLGGFFERNSLGVVGGIT